ncbi:MAG: hypothetical protein ACLFVA_04010 [Dehalococcoidia bacterium]
MNGYNTGSVKAVKAAVVRDGIQNAFSTRLRQSRKEAHKIIIASPWIGYRDSSRGPLTSIVATIDACRIPTYVFTRQPQNTTHIQGVNALMRCPYTEIVYNNNLHAKLYICMAPYPYGFAIMGSANLTSGSEALYEIGLLILAQGGGEEIVKQLASFGLDYLRTRPDSRVIKRFSSRRLP